MVSPWIAIETSGDYASVAARLPAGEVIEEVIPGTRQHARELVPALERVLRQGQLTLAEIRGALVSEGPGSFTGLRIGATVVKALAHVHRFPVRSASALAVIARGAWLESAVATSAGCEQKVLSVTDALRGEVFAALYHVGPRAMKVMEPPTVLKPAELALWPAPDVRASSPPHASILIDLLEVEGGTDLVEDLETWEPAYGRPAEAQAKWEATHGRRLPHSTSTTR
jgi:tRNA threonylcarbamoyladenosine biosynthesis protein TsaB